MRFPNIRTIPSADIEIPGELSGLYDLAYNLWWTWQPNAHSLFSVIDAASAHWTSSTVATSNPCALHPSNS